MSQPIYSVDPICFNPTRVCEEREARVFGVYEKQEDGRRMWIADHRTRDAAEAEAAVFERNFAATGERLHRD
jgi:hypothetical protein